MSLLDLFTGQPGKDAAGAALNTFNATKGNIFNLADLTRRRNEDIIRGGYGQARTDLGAGYGTAADAVTGGTNRALGFLDEGTTGALSQLDRARGDLSTSGDIFGELGRRYGLGSSLYSDALGINGPEGNTRATSAFTNSPGYQRTLDAGIDAVNRSRAARGMLNSGNTDQDAQLFATDLANKDYTNWLTRLQGFQPLELSAATGGANINRSLADLGVTAGGFLNQGGQNKAGFAGREGLTLADLARAQGTGLAGLDTGETSALTGNMSDNTKLIANSDLQLAPQIANTFKDSAAAGLQGDKNLLNFGMSLAQLGAGVPWGSWFGGGFPASADAFRMGFASPNVRA